MKHEIDLLDTEYMTPQQAAELRRTMTELPLWQQVAPNVDVAPHAIDCFSTEAPKSDGYDADEYTASDRKTMQADLDAMTLWLADVDLHRALNGTVGMESEE